MCACAGKIIMFGFLHQLLCLQFIYFGESIFAIYWDFTNHIYLCGSYVLLSTWGREELKSNNSYFLNISPEIFLLS